MDKDNIKTKLFWDNAGPSTQIIGSIIDIDYSRNEGLFWIQYPTNLKRLLNYGRHKPNLFFLYNLKDQSYKPKIGEYISCNYIIDSCGNIVFINIAIDLYLTRKFLGSQYLPFYIDFRKKSQKKSVSKTNPSNSKRKNSIKCRINSTPKTAITKLKKVPRVFMIIGHSAECDYKTGYEALANKKIINILKNSYTTKTNYHELVNNSIPIAKGKQHLHFKKIEKDYKTLLNGKRVKCHIYPEEDALIFCGICFASNYSNYFYSDKCIIANKGHLELNNYITVNDKELTKKEFKDKKKYPDDNHSYYWDTLKYRIDLQNDFKKDYPVKKLVYMNGQSAGRSGLTETSYDIMNYMQKWEQFREQLYSSNTMKDMTKLDKTLNKINKVDNLHADKKDTNFAIYPRKNKSGRIINGPKDGFISFYPSEIDMNQKRNEFLNGCSWPLGIYELPIFNINETQTHIDKYNAINNLSYYKYDTLFNNNLKNEKGNFTSDSFEKEWQFFSILKKKDERAFLNRAFLLNYPKLNKTKEQSQLTSWESEIKEITKYNKFLMTHIDNKWEFNPHKNFLLSDLIKNILRIGNIKKEEEVIIISNACRGIQFKDQQNYGSFDQSAIGTGKDTPNHIQYLIKQLRENSRN